jgi:hypothetical protein
MFADESGFEAFDADVNPHASWPVSSTLGGNVDLPGNKRSEA